LGLGQLQQNLPPQLQDKRVLGGIIAAVVLLIIIGIAMSFFGGGSEKKEAEALGKPKELLKKINQIQALEICSVLKKNDVKCEMEILENGDTTIVVYENQLDNAVLLLAGSQVLNKADFSLFDKTDWAASDEDRRVKLMRAMSGQAAKIIGRMDGIRSTDVTFNIPAKRLFKSDMESPSATISLIMKPGVILADHQVASIISIIRGFDSEITPSHISITDQHRVYSEATNGDGGSGFGSSTGEHDRNQIQDRVQRYLDSLFGYGNATAMVSVSLETAKMMKNETKFLPGAIASHDFAEEAIGEPSKKDSYYGEMHHKEVDSVEDSNDQEEIVQYGKTDEELLEEIRKRQVADPRLMKDLSPEEQERVLRYELELEKRKQRIASGYECDSSYGNICKKDYRQHNFSIENYPSYEQIITQKEGGDIKSVKVAIVIDRKSFPNSISLINLKKAIAAVADPHISETDVEIVFRELSEQETVSQDSDKQSEKKNDKFPLIFIIIGVTGLLALVGIVFFLGNLAKNKIAGNTSSNNFEYKPRRGGPLQQEPPPFYNIQETPPSSPILAEDFSTSFEDTPVAETQTEPTSTSDDFSSDFSTESDFSFEDSKKPEVSKPRPNIKIEDD